VVQAWVRGMAPGACSDDGGASNGGDAGDGPTSGGEPSSHGGATSGSGGATSGSGGTSGHAGGGLGGAPSDGGGGGDGSTDIGGAGGDGLVIAPAGGAGGAAGSDEELQLLGACEPRGLSKDGKTVLADQGIWTLESGWVPLPDLAGGAVGNTPRALSADGKVVFGNSSSAMGEEMYRWTATGGIQGLGVTHLPFAASLDGSIAAGWIEVFEDSPRPFRWTNAGGFVDLGTVMDTLSTNGFMDAHLSDAGDVAQFSLDRDRASWSLNDGLDQVNSLLRVTAMSADGSKIATLYTHSNGDTNSTGQCFTDSSGPPEPAPSGCPLDLSEVWVALFDYDDSGTLGVGVQITDDEYLAFYWTEDTGMWRLDDLLPNGLESYTTPLTHSLAQAYPTRPFISGDGRIVLSRAKNGDCFLAEVEIPTDSGS
jgi:hypothetical protein